MTQKQTRSAVSPAFQLNSAMLVSKERQAGSRAAALPLCTQRSGPASPPARRAALRTGGGASVITAEISSAGLHSFAHQEAPARATAVDVSADAAPPSSSASQPPSPLPPERLTVQDGNHGCGTDYCPQIKKKRGAPLLSYFSLPHRLCLTAILVFSTKMQWF